MSSSSISSFWQPKQRRKTGKGHDEGGLGIRTVRSTPVPISNQHESGTEVPERCRASPSQLASYPPKYQVEQKTPNTLPTPSIYSATQDLWQQLPARDRQINSQKSPGLLTIDSTLPPTKSHVKFRLYEQKNPQALKYFLCKQDLQNMAGEMRILCLHETRKSYLIHERFHHSTVLLWFHYY